MKRTFHITSSTGADTGNAVLLCEISQHHVCIAVADATSKNIDLLSYYEVKNELEPDKFRQLMKAEGLDTVAFRRIIVNNAAKEALIIPAHRFTEESARRFYMATFGFTGDPLFFDELPEENAVLVHAMQPALLSHLKAGQETETKHNYSCWLKAVNNLIAEAGMAVHFTSREINVAAKHENQLKLVQTYNYATPMDVVYYLLATAREYGLSQTGTTLVLSGLINDDSAMYKELHQYFSHIRFWKPAVRALQSEYPHHFFSSMYNLAACVL